MKKTKQIMSLLLAVFMMVMTVVPVMAEETTVKASDVVGTFTEDDISKTKPNKTKLTVHKLVADKYNKGIPVEHNGGLLDATKLGKLGTNVKELDNIKFTWYKISDVQLENMNKTPDTYKSKEKVEHYLTGTFTDTNKGTTWGEITTAGGNGATVELSEGAYWFVEDYQSNLKDGSSVDKSYAVPFGITLPLMNTVEVEGNVPGTVYLKNVHVYPKNTVDKIEVDKNFLKEKTKGMDDKEFEEFKKTLVPAQMSEEDFNKLYADIKNYDTAKSKINLTVGSKIPYEVVTKVPMNWNYSKMIWEDIMTEGLTFNKDSLSLTAKKLDNASTVVTFETTDYTLVENQSGYKLTLNAAGAKKLKEAAQGQDVQLTLRYSATLNSQAAVDSLVSDKPEFNKISVRTVEGPQPKEFKNSKEITVNKNWDEGQIPQGVEITFFLFEKDEVNGDKVVDSYRVTTETSAISHKFENLDTSKTYYIKEVARGYEGTYGEVTIQDGVASQTITNKKTPEGNNITPIVPKTPEIRTYGKKFVKTDDKEVGTAKRLAGAEFVIYRKDANSQTKEYLALGEDQAGLVETFNTKKDAYIKAVDAFNAAVEAYNNDKTEVDTREFKVRIGNQDFTGTGTENVKTAKENAQKEIDKLKTEMDKAHKAIDKAWKWVNSADNAYKLVSNQAGQFEIKGLAEGTYYLEEVKTPNGYAKIADQEFTVDKNSYTKNGDVAYTPAVGDLPPVGGSKVAQQGIDAKQIKNKKVTIPQTGGIGTIIFTVAGIALMAGAAFALKKNAKED